jgi:hypothetical protein
MDKSLALMRANPNEIEMGSPPQKKKRDQTNPPKKKNNWEKKKSGNGRKHIKVHHQFMDSGQLLCAIAIYVHRDPCSMAV